MLRMDLHKKIFLTAFDTIITKEEVTPKNVL